MLKRSEAPSKTPDLVGEDVTGYQGQEKRIWWAERIL